MQSKPFAFAAAAALVALSAAGCAKGSDQSSSSSTTTTTSGATHGKTIFGARCATCHGAGGEGGGVGPSLKNEKSRKSFDKTVAWIKNPQPPMPKLFPDPLSATDVNDVAAYVQTL